jgi:hypothetical protein
MSMSKPELIRVFGLLFLAGFLAVPTGGCGDGAVTTPPAAPPLDREKLAAALPSGVTLDTPVKPDKAYGESSKTVGDALKNLLATVKDNTISDALGHEIRFQSSSTPVKAPPKGQRAQIVVYLAN